jgi:transposase
MEMGRKRRIFTDKFKAKVAVEAIKGIKTLNELASEYQVHPNQISDWKKQLLSNAPELFASGKKRQVKTEEELTAPLYEEIGRTALPCANRLIDQPIVMAAVEHDLSIHTNEKEIIRFTHKAKSDPVFMDQLTFVMG